MAKIVITPFHNCSTGIKDVIDYRNLGVKNIFFNELPLATMEIPDELKLGK